MPDKGHKFHTTYEKRYFESRVWRQNKASILSLLQNQTKSMISKEAPTGIICARQFDKVIVHGQASTKKKKQDLHCMTRTQKTSEKCTSSRALNAKIQCGHEETIMIRKAPLSIWWAKRSISWTRIEQELSPNKHDQRSRLGLKTLQGEALSGAACMIRALAWLCKSAYNIS